MKIWLEHGSEHSSNMVMIGRFQTATDMKKVTDAIDEIKEYIEKTGDTHEGADRYSDHMLELIIKHGLHTLHPSEIDQFNFDIKIDKNDKEIVFTTEEADFSAYLKVLVENKAKVEVYSAHFYRNTGKGR
jgi:hypothetical protein